MLGRSLFQPFTRRLLPGNTSNEKSAPGALFRLIANDLFVQFSGHMHAICSVKSLELTLKMIAIIGIDELVISFNHSLIRTIYHITAAAIEVVLLMRGIRHVIAHAPNAFFTLPGIFPAQK